MRKIFFLIAMACLLLSGPTSVLAADINVYPGDSIQAALDGAQSGDTITVHPGTYTENLVFRGRQVTLQSAVGPSGTIIDGGGSGPVVTFQSGEQRDTTIEGFTLRNGAGIKLDGLDYGFGGGILCRGSSPTITGNIIEDNQADPSSAGLFGLGGGICVFDASFPALSGNTIRSNTAESGGGIYVFTTNDPDATDSASTAIEGNTISENSAQLGGALFVCGNSHPVMTSDNSLTGNTQMLGSDIYVCSDSSVETVTLVELASFKAIAGIFRVFIFWQTHAEVNHAGFNLYRSTAAEGPYEKINDALILSRGAPIHGALYFHTDRNVQIGRTYYYRLEDIDMHGATTRHGPVHATPGRVLALKN
jgi:hypothetical protein